MLAAAAAVVSSTYVPVSVHGLGVGQVAAAAAGRVGDAVEEGRVEVHVCAVHAGPVLQQQGHQGRYHEAAHHVQRTLAPRHVRLPHLCARVQQNPAQTHTLSSSPHLHQPPPLQSYRATTMQNELKEKLAIDKRDETLGIHDNVRPRYMPKRGYLQK